MKKSIVLTLCLLIFCGMYAKRITAIEAQRAAMQFVNELRQQTRSAGKAAKLKQARYEGELCYVFDIGKKNGFVIVSADDRTEQILGYTTTGSFNHASAPTNLLWWLACYEEQIKALDNAPETPVVTKTEDKRESISPLIVTNWDQDEPYNLKAPKVNGQATYTGCLATAMAQLLYYHRSPKKSTAVIPEYVTYTRGIRMPELPATTFDWDNMRTTYKGNVTAKEAEAVAKLMLYCGQAVSMDYNTNASGAYVDEEVFEKYFGFTPGTREVQRSSCTLKQWEKLIYSELKAGRPVLYTGGKLSGGHAFVCDGYDGNGAFHINWGWGGQSDGYFKLSVLNPSDQGSGSIEGTDGYTLSQTAVVALRTDSTKIEPQEEDVRLMAKQVSIYQKSDTRSTAADNFYISSLGIYAYNMTSAMKSFQLAWALYKDSTMISTFAQENINNLKPEYRVSLTTNIELGANLADGTYKLLPVCRLAGSQDWTPCINADLCFLDLEIKGLKLSITPHNDPVDKLKVNALTFRGKLQVNRPVEVHLDITNEGKENNPQLYLFVNGRLTSATTASIDPGTTGEVSLHFVPSNAATHRIRVCQDRTGTRLLIAQTVEIAPGKAAKLDIATSVTNADDAAKKIYATTMKCHISVTNKGTEPYSDVISCKLYKVEGGYGYLEQSKEQEVQLTVDSVAQLDFEFTGLEDGESYFFIPYYISENEETGNEMSKIYTISIANGIIRVDKYDNASELLPVFTLQGTFVAKVRRQDLPTLLQRLPKRIYVAGKGEKVKN